MPSRGGYERLVEAAGSPGVGGAGAALEQAGERRQPPSVRKHKCDFRALGTSSHQRGCRQVLAGASVAAKSASGQPRPEPEPEPKAAAQSAPQPGAPPPPPAPTDAAPSSSDTGGGGGGGGGGRAGLLSAIAGGASLKPTKTVDKSGLPPAAEANAETDKADAEAAAAKAKEEEEKVEKEAQGPVRHNSIPAGKKSFRSKG